MKTYEHVSTGEIFCTNRDMLEAFPGSFVELKEFTEDKDVEWDETFRAFMSTKVEDGERKEFRWDYVHIANNGLYKRF